MSLEVKLAILFVFAFMDFARVAFFDPPSPAIFKNGEKRYGSRELSPNIIKRLEERADVAVLGEGFPPEMIDDEPEETGYEVVIKGRKDY